jgi:acetyltransferase
MIKAIRAVKLLKGFRGAPAADLEALQQALVRLSDLAMNHPEIKELDINPLLAHPEGQGATVADCRMLLAADDDPA